MSQVNAVNLDDSNSKPPVNANASNSFTSASQDKQLGDARASIKYDALQMKKSLDKLDLLEAIKHTSNMLNKLSSTARINNVDVPLSLSPKSYYELCNFYQTQMRFLLTKFN